MTVVEDRRGADRDIEEVFGLVPEFFQRVPDYLLPTEWASFKSFVLSDQTGTTSIYLQGINAEEIIATVHGRRGPMMSATAGLHL